MPTLPRYQIARFAGWLRPRRSPPETPPASPAPANGLSVVIPSRNGKDLLRAQLPGIQRDLEGLSSEVIVVDNGSDDGTAAWLRSAWPAALVEVSPEPLSFARAVNRGIARARYSHVCLLNNDMLLDPGFFAALGAAFDQVPDLFCATAQIRFPAGVRREETGKAVMAQSSPEDFPLRCDEPFPGEDLTWVLYGSGGCSIYDAPKLRALGTVDEVYEPAYVEDLDLGYRAWQRGWPSVYVAAAVVEHRHRATTSRYYTEEDLERILELNYLRFLVRAVYDAKLFRRLWNQAVLRLELRAPHSPAAADALRAAPSFALQGGPAVAAALPEESILALTDGSVAVFPGRARPDGAPIVEAVSSLAARRGAVVVAYTDTLQTPPPAILAACREVVLIRTGNELAFRAALQQTVRKWHAAEVRVESRAWLRYREDCAPARVTVAK